jgi:hypothetical protein
MTSESNKPKVVRGKAAAALLLNSDDDENYVPDVESMGIYHLKTEIKFEGMDSAGKEIKLKFFVAVNVPFKALLRSFCHRNNLVGWQDYIVELYGEQVNLEKNSEDYNLIGDEVFDVKKRPKYCNTNCDLSEDIFS